MSDHSNLSESVGRLYTRNYSGADPLPMWGLEGFSMVPSVTSVHVTDGESAEPLLVMSREHPTSGQELQERRGGGGRAKEERNG
jgi:hypothetical protein